MKISQVKMDNEIVPEGYELLVGCIVDSKKEDRMGIIFGSQDIDVTQMLTAVSRINRIVAKTIDIPYPTFLKILDGAAKFDEKYGSLNLSEEQLEKMVGKELRGYDLKRD